MEQNITKQLEALSFSEVLWFDKSYDLIKTLLNFVCYKMEELRIMYY